MEGRWTLHSSGGETVDVDGDVDRLIGELRMEPGAWTLIHSSPDDRPVWVRGYHVTHISQKPTGASFH
jgi:hypothetical protein